MWFARWFDTILDGAEAPLPARAAARTPASSVGRRALRALQCRRGATGMVEFGFVAPALMVLLLGAVEMGLQGAVAVALDNAALRASRTGSLGRLNTDGTRAGPATKDCVVKAARAAGGGLLNGDLQLNMVNYSTATAAGADPNRDNGTGASGAGSGSRTVVYELTYNQPYVFVGKLFGQKAKHTTVLTTQNEPFANASQTATAASC